MDTSSLNISNTVVAWDDKQHFWLVDISTPVSSSTFISSICPSESPLESSPHLRTNTEILGIHTETDAFHSGKVQSSDCAITLQTKIVMAYVWEVTEAVVAKFACL